jgi:N-acetylglucosaminyldiphosphoundecaprenol N-acetyl-beta-D-mannosaminyltransferase
MGENFSTAVPYDKSCSILGVRLNPVSSSQLQTYIEQVIQSRRKALVLHANIHCINLCHKFPWMKDFINQAHLVYCDGDGVRWGARMLGINPPPKITGDRWIWQLAELSEQRGYRLYFIGGKPGVAGEAAEAIRQRFSHLQIVGTHHGYFEKAGNENDLVIAQINQAQPDIVVVGFGMPVQERWVRDNWQNIDANILWTAGAVLDYASGRAKRAPAWMIRLNLEWLFRWIQEPRRLCVRYLWGNPCFMIRVLTQRGWLRRPRNRAASPALE